MDSAGKKPHKSLSDLQKKVTGTPGVVTKKALLSPILAWPQKGEFQCSVQMLPLQWLLQSPPPSVPSPEAPSQVPPPQTIGNAKIAAVFWFESNQEGSDWMLEKVQYLYGVPMTELS